MCANRFGIVKFGVEDAPSITEARVRLCGLSKARVRCWGVLLAVLMCCVISGLCVYRDAILGRYPDTVYRVAILGRYPLFSLCHVSSPSSQLSLLHMK